MKQLAQVMRNKYFILFTLAPFIVILDQWTKTAITDRFRLGETLPIISGFFHLTYVRNTGAAFGFLAHADPSFRVPFFLIMPILALIAIGFVFRKISPQEIRMAFAFSLVIAGAIGNLIDRVLLGYVVDFLDFHWNFQYHFPAFNVADSAICVGVGLLSLDLLKPNSVQKGAVS